MPTALRLRKNAANLSAKERTAFVGALLKLKAAGTYDKFVHWHHEVMGPAVLPWEPASGDYYRNGAHRGPAFLPWHRIFLLRLEEELQKVDPSVTLPYWDWTTDQDPAQAAIWQPDFLGGNGVETDQWRVQDGAFAEKNGHWPVPEYQEDPGLPGTGLKRQFATIPGYDKLPTAGDLSLALRQAVYDWPPYSCAPFNLGFRNFLEGFVTELGSRKWTYNGVQLHNRVHLWVGGNMTLMTSPDDPIFFLHHAFIDMVWAVWQEDMRTVAPHEFPHYAPIEGGPPGHNYNSVMRPFNVLVRDAFDIKKLGYEYESFRVLVGTAKPPFHSPFLD